MIIDHEIDNMINSLDSLPTYSIIESLYVKNRESPLFHEKSASNKYKELFIKVEEVLCHGFQDKKAECARDLPLTSLFSIGEMIVYILQRSPKIIVEVMRPDYLTHFLSCHLLNVSILSCNLGAQLGLNFRERVELAVAALVHDIGITVIDSATFSHDRRLSDQEKNIVESHPMEGYELLESVKDELPWLVRVILEEHKRENGSGYPSEVTGELHIYSKIVGICDTFEALTHRRHHRKAFHPADAMKQIIKGRNNEYDNNLVKALIDAVALYPIGSFVVLNNEKIAKVVRAIPKNPLRPDVQIIENEKPQICSLLKETNIHIAGIVYDESYQAVDSEYAE